MSLHQFQLLLVSVVHKSMESINFELEPTFLSLGSTPSTVLFIIKFMNGPSMGSYFWLSTLVLTVEFT